MSGALSPELPAGERLLIAEHAAADGAFERTVLVARERVLLLAVLRRTSAAAPDGVQAVAELPAGAVDAVMRRYGKPVADDIAEPSPALVLGDGAVLGTFRHLARFDVIARDYVYYRPGGDASGLAALAVTVAAALRFLALRP